MVDFLFTNGVIAVKEKDLLKDKIIRFCEMDEAEALRALSESGFGSGSESESPAAETLIAAEEEKLDGFIRTYAASGAELAYLLSPRDFHNAKALFKAEYLRRNAEKMLAPEGLIPVSVLLGSIREKDYSALDRELAEALQEADSLCADGENVSGALIGGVFERALFRLLKDRTKRNSTLKKLVAAKADMTNILTALRSDDRAYAKKLFVAGGTLKEETLLLLCSADEKAEKSLEDTPYKTFARECFKAKRDGKPFTEAEKMLASYDTEYLAVKKFELQKEQPFLYYVFRRRAEIVNVRMVFVCLAAGMREQEIKNRLRTV